MTAERLLVGVRKPWVLVDQVTALSTREITCLKLVSSSDFFLVGHFPDRSIYPGVLLLEGIRQSAQILLSQRGFPPLHLASTEARFLAPVSPGALLSYTVTLLESDGGRAVLSGRGQVSGEDVVRARLCLSLPAACDLPPDGVYNREA